jgi:hypothetical protein
MAYKNLVAEAISSRSEVFKRFRDWVCKRNGSYDYSSTGLGWELIDSSYAVSEGSPASNDYFVAKSVGESGKEDLYIKVTYSSTSGMIQIQHFQYWDAATHVGVNGMNAVNNWQVTESGIGTLYIYGSLDFVMPITLIGAAQYGAYSGLITDAEYDRTIAISSGSVAAGSNVVITVDTVPSSWVVGGRVVIRDDANMERIMISDIDGLNVTFVSLVSSYASGCKIAEDYPVITNNTTGLTGVYAMMFSHNSIKQSLLPTTSAVPITLSTSGDPDPLNGDFLATPYEFGDTSTGYYGRIEILGMSATGFTHLGVYTTPGGVNYRAFISLYTGFPCLVKEV